MNAYATAYDMTESEEFYNTESKKNEEEFIQRLKGGTPFSDAEERYTRNAKKIRKQFEKRYKKELEQQPSPKKQKKKNDKDAEFIVEHVNLKKTQQDEFKRVVARKRYQYTRTVYMLLRHRTFNVFRYLYFWAKYKRKSAAVIIQIYKDKAIKRITKIKTTAKEHYTTVKQHLKTLKQKFHKEKTGQKKEEQKGDKKTANEATKI